MREHRLTVASLLLLVTSILVRSPEFLSSYYTNIGSYKLYRAFSSSNQHGDPLGVSDQVSIGGAVNDLQVAIHWDQDNSHANDLLVEAYAASSQVVQMAYGAQRLVRAKDEDPAELWRLGLIYQRMAYLLDLAADWEQSGQSKTESSLISPQALGVLDWPPNGQKQSADILIITVIHPSGVNSTLMPESRFHVSLVPFSSEVELPLVDDVPRGSVLTVFLGRLESENWHDTPEIQLNISIEKEGQRKSQLGTLGLRGTHKWTEMAKALPQWQGSDATLILRSAPRETGGEKGQDPNLGRSSITVKNLPSLAELWHGLDWNVDLLVRLGDEEWRDGNIPSALFRYRQATVLRPEAAYIWERISRVYESQSQWECALSTYRRVVVSEDQTGITSLAGIYAKMASIERWYLREPDWNAYKIHLYAALSINDFPTVREEADVHYELAVVLEDEGAFSEALQEVQRAVRVNPTHIWAHVRLGWLLYRVRSDVRGAEKELALALDLGAKDRQAYWAYRHLGVIEWREGSKDEATSMFENALRADPSSGQTLSQLKQEALGE